MCWDLTDELTHLYQLTKELTNINAWRSTAKTDEANSVQVNMLLSMRTKLVKPYKTMT